MHYLESDSVDPRFNLALEQVVFDSLDPAQDCFMLWRNDNAIIVGKHQNTAAEINAEYVRQRNIHVVRRLSGGGAVYHDLGNVNFTFITAAGGDRPLDFGAFCRPVVRALAALGVTAEISGRNDMTIGGRKFSGNAQYRKRGRVLHHGTILYDSDLSVLGKALMVPKDKYESKAVQSVRSRVCNIRDHMAADLGVERFMEELRDAMFREFAMEPHALSAADRDATRRLQRDVYDTWAWNFGESPAYRIRKERRVDGCGKIEVHMDVERGTIRRIAFFGDYFGDGDSAELGRLLEGARLERGCLRETLAAIAIGDYFHNLDPEAFVDILTE
ncbi:lipoate--protein ligase [Rhodoplanes sp. TEM]|uniref:lipoate--protein ligase n=1 Tax=Rhodoplanes tepidamans TaxID=200616 RepID=A0ABT5JGP6_RHOTP|nr:MULTISPECIES: lipoate--protein ligase [Rhodoplanes]MDC7788881.1 lipoate--protein ligase [Rhodoplanes tepidamans]MDC7987510.1 lipoate--protein ligase [Rhodoplanes sp. TEM]MDQ0355117.1 lipoate-protein ligase A [Rhodoplanes tepidamans]